MRMNLCFINEINVKNNYNQLPGTCPPDVLRLSRVLPPLPALLSVVDSVEQIGSSLQSTPRNEKNFLMHT